MSSTIETLYNGLQPLSKCWYSKKNSNYYLIGDIKVKDSGGAYKMQNGRYATRPKIVWSQWLGEYIRKSQAIEILLDQKGNRSFTDARTIISDEQVYDTNKHEFVNVAQDTDLEIFDFDISTGVFYIGSDKGSLYANLPIAKTKKIYQGYATNIYSFADLPQEIKDITTLGANKPKPEAFSHDVLMAMGAGDITFGVELETSRCLLPQKYLTEYGFIPVKDGSIKGNELVSVPMQGLNGLRNIYHFATKLNKYAQVDASCSLHVHQGNIRVDDEQKFIAALHWLYVLLQNELLEMVPRYKTDFKVLARNDNGNGKDYCAAVPPLNLRGKSSSERYDKIFTWCNDYRPACSDFNPRTRKHYKGDVAKWNIKSRYYSLNLYNRFFSNSRTIEYRLHHGVTDPKKVINWLAITLAITQFAIKHQDKILKEKIKYDLGDIVDDIYEAELSSELKLYIDQTKGFFNDQKLMDDNGLVTTFQYEEV